MDLSMIYWKGFLIQKKLRMMKYLSKVYNEKDINEEIIIEEHRF